MTEGHSELQDLLRRWARSRPSVRVLEAGCGSTSHLDFGPGATLVGIDISEEQLLRNHRLDERILGDIQAHPLPRSGFDLVVSWDVLEHLPDPERALLNLFGAVREGGLVVLAFPNLLSLKGIVTKCTPYRLHELFYRHVIGDTRSRSQGFGQFPTYLRASLRPARLVRFAESNGMSVEYLRIYEGPVQRSMRQRHPLADWLLGAAGTASRLASLGRYDINHTDVVLVLRKPL